MEPNDQEDLANRLLAAALQHYASAEPRSGFEQRLLARLRLEQEQRASVVWNWRLVPAAMAVLAVLGSALFISRRTDARRTEVVGPTTVAISDLPSSSIIPHEPTDRTFSIDQQSARTLRVSVRHSANSMSNEKPREQFPSPQPLSKQEQLLVLYVSRFHQQAAQTAREQTELFKNEEAERASTSISYSNDEEKFHEND